MALKWNGDNLKAKALAASEYGVDKTMAEAVVQAKTNHPGWHNRTGTAEGSIKVQEFADAAPDRPNVVRGLWGSSGVNYFIWLELKHGAALRAAAQAIYPKLRAYIRERFAQ